MSHERLFSMRASAPNEPVSTSEAAALFAGLSDAPVLILAVSGGPDSTAMMWLAARWRARRKHGPTLVAVTIDHGLRAESAREALAVKRLAKTLNVEHRTLRWTGRKPKTGMQEAARNARYRLLADAAHRADAGHILTAHTLDDQAETVLFRLARGSGLSGLRGMASTASLPGLTRQSIEEQQIVRRRMDARVKPAHDESLLLVRPLLSLPKSRLRATLRAAKIPFADDPSNRDPRFTRPRLRELMPGLAAEGLDARRFARFARRMARADQAIEHAADVAGARLSRGAGPVVFSRQYADLPAEVALRLLGRAVAQVGNEGPVELAKLEALYDALAAAMAQKPPAARFRRTLAGALVTFAGEITVERAPPRRSGAPAGTKRRKGAFTKAG
jgi:tRNA(Ile)-lysidine synthase